MKKLKCKKQFGTWYYKIIKAEKYGTCAIEFDTYELYNSKQEFVNVFGSYGDLKYFIETEIIL